MVLYSVKKCKTRKGYVRLDRPSCAGFSRKETILLEGVGAKWDKKEEAFILPLDEEYKFTKLVKQGKI